MGYVLTTSPPGIPSPGKLPRKHLSGGIPLPAPNGYLEPALPPRFFRSSHHTISYRQRLTERSSRCLHEVNRYEVG